MKLTAEQRSVVDADCDTKMVVEAIPGSGKTEVLAWRLASLIRRGVGPAQLMVLSFSNAAVRTLMARVRKVAKTSGDELDDLRHVSIRTFDSWAFRLLIASGRNARDILGGGYEQGIINATEVIADGGDLGRAVHGVHHVFIDEVQDLTGARAELALALLRRLSGVSAAKGAGFTLLGDQHQGIYGFSDSHGSSKSPKEFLGRVRDTWGRCLVARKLSVNHRLSKDLLKISEKARAALEKKKGADALEAIRKIVDTFPRVDSTVEEPVGGSAILCRTNAQALVIADHLWGRGDAAKGVFPVLNAGDQVKSSPAWIGYVLSHATEVGELTSELFKHVYAQMLAANGGPSTPSPDAAWVYLQKCLKSPPDSPSINLDSLRERLGWVDFIPDDESAAPEGSLEITTIHQSKGREFENVVLLGGPIEDSAQDDHELMEEARVIYVGMTRSRQFVRLWVPSISTALYPTRLWGNHTRLCRFANGGVRLEGGLRRDVDPLSFVNPDVLGCDPMDLQKFLWEMRDDLVGRKVVLVKQQSEPNKAFYQICLQENDLPGKVIGSMSDMFRKEILGAHNKANKKYSLPGRIFNLRIASVCAYSAPRTDTSGLPAPWSNSGFWIGVSLTGLGYFKLFKKWIKK